MMASMAAKSRRCRSANAGTTIGARQMQNGNPPNPIGNRNAGKQRKTNEAIKRKESIPVMTIAAIAVVIAKTTIVARIGGANAQRNTVTAVVEETVMTTTTMIVRGAIRATANPIGRRGGGNAKKTCGRNGANENIRDVVAMIIRLRRHRMMVPMILRITKDESTEKTRSRKRRKKAANQ